MIIIYYVPQTVMRVVAKSLPKLLTAVQVTPIWKISTLKSDSRALLFNCRMLSFDDCICSIRYSERFNGSGRSGILSEPTMKENSGSGFGSLPSKHSKVILNNTESMSSRQKSIPIL